MKPGSESATYTFKTKTEEKKLDGVGPVDNRPSTNKKGGPKQLWQAT